MIESIAQIYCDFVELNDLMNELILKLKIESRDSQIPNDQKSYLYLKRLCNFYYCESKIGFEMFKDIIEKLNLDMIPHFTILHKFVSRIPFSLFNFILSRILKLFYSHRESVSITAIATGFKSSYASHYYSIKTGKLLRSLLKTSISVDTMRKVIFG